MTSLQTPTDQLQFSGASAGGFGGAVVPIYIIWYENLAHPWTTANQQLVEDWFNYVATTPWFGFARDYPNANGTYAIGLSVAGTWDDTRGETNGTVVNVNGNDAAAKEVLDATTFNCPTGGSTPCLPTNPNAIYVVLPSWTDMTCTQSCLGYHYAVGGVPYLVAIQTSMHPLGNAPNNINDPAVDTQIVTVSHETAEAIANGWGANVMTFCNGACEIGDVCVSAGTSASALLYMSNAFIMPITPHVAVNMVLTNGSGAQRYYWVQDIWSREQGGHCINGQTPAALSNLAPCRKAADCPWSKLCVNGSCAVPTCSDGIQNQDESDVDCGSTCGMIFDTGLAGGTYVGNCALGQKCTTNWDCASSACNILATPFRCQ